MRMKNMLTTAHHKMMQNSNLSNHGLEKKQPRLSNAYLGYFISKNFPTYPWNIPQTPNQEFMKGFLSFGGLGIHGVCSLGVCWGSLRLLGSTVHIS